MKKSKKRMKKSKKKSLINNDCVCLISVPFACVYSNSVLESCYSDIGVNSASLMHGLTKQLYFLHWQLFPSRPGSPILGNQLTGTTYLFLQFPLWPGR